MTESVGFRSGLGSLGGGTLGQVLVRVGLDTKQLDAGMAKAKGEASAAGSTFSKFGAYASAAFALAGIAAVKFAADAIQSAQEHEAVLAQLRVAIDGGTAAFEDQATALQNLTGFQDEEVLAADAVLARFQLTRAEISKLMPLVLDFATATGRDAAQSAELLGKALLGNARALKTIGVEFTRTGDHEKDLAEITKQLEDRVGGASEAFGETFAGRVAILSAQFDDFKEAVGGFLIPIIEQAIIALQDFASSVGVILDLIPGVKPSAEEAAGGLSTMEKASGLLALALKSVTHPVSTLMHGAFVDIPDGTSRAAAGFDDLSGATEGFTKQLEDNAQALRDEKTAMKALAGDAVGLLASLDQLKSAQRDLNKARHDSKTTASELRAAELDVLQAQLGVTGSFKDLVEKMTDAHASAEDIVDRFSEMATKAGLTKSEIAGLTQFIQGYIDKLHQIPSAVNTDVTVNRNLVTTGGSSHPRPGGSGSGGSSPQQGARGLTVNIISPTDPGEAIKQNLESWQRANRDWAG